MKIIENFDKTVKISLILSKISKINLSKILMAKLSPKAEKYRVTDTGMSLFVNKFVHTVNIDIRTGKKMPAKHSFLDPTLPSPRL